MAHIYSDRGWLVLSFQFAHQGRQFRCREYLKIRDTREGRRLAEKITRELSAEIASGHFDYAKRFPASRMLAKLGIDPTRNDPTLEEFSRAWLKEREASRPRGTIEFYKSLFRSQLWNSVFAARRISALSDGDVALFLAERRGAGVPADRVNRIRAALFTLFRVAARRKLIAENPVAHTDRLPRETESEIDPFTADEVRALLEAAQGWERRLVAVSVGTGIRPGELVGLKWDDVDLAAGQVHIRRSRGNWGEGAPKTRKSRRRIDLSAPARQALAEQRAASRLRSAYVFPNTEGGPLDRHNFTQRNWRRILARASVRPRPFEQLRHTWATLMLSDPDTDLRYVADQMGHRNLEMLLKHYVRWMPGRVAKPKKDAIAAALAADNVQRKAQ